MEKKENNSISLILASASPRRRELMGRMGRDFTAEVSDAVEKVPGSVCAADTAEYLSGIKAEDVYSKHSGENAVVIGSDTIVLLDGHIYGKPHSAEEAYGMLRALSGRIHEVRTGVTVISSEWRFSFTEAAEVEFYELTDDEIWEYIATGEPFDKAGAYGVQAYGSLLVKSIRGDFYTVMGFPIGRLHRELKARGI